jgi:hypothetical protein
MFVQVARTCPFASLMETTPMSLIKRIDETGERVRGRLDSIATNFLLLMFGPALILIGLHSLPPQWRPGLHWPIHGEQAPASVELIHLALRHVQNDAKIDNVQASVSVTLAFKDGAGKMQHALVAGRWLLQMATQWTGDAAWLYLADIGNGIGTGPLELDMPRDIAAQLAVPHQEFGISEKTAANLDRPLRWAAMSWLAPQHALTVRYDPLHPAVAIPEFLIERESTRLQGVGVLRILGFGLGCLLVGVLAWRVFTFPNRLARFATALLAIASVWWWSPYVSTLVRVVAPGIDAWSGLDIDEVVADPIGVFYDEFLAGPFYAVGKSVPARLGVAWTADNLTAHALTKWLRSVPVNKPVHGSIEDAENALTSAAKGTMTGLGDDELAAISADLTAMIQRQYWIGSNSHYAELRDAMQIEQARRGAAAKQP